MLVTRERAEFGAQYCHILDPWLQGAVEGGCQQAGSEKAPRNILLKPGTP